MKWFSIEYKLHGKSDHEHLLYSFLGYPRQLMLPAIKGEHYYSLKPVRESLPREVEDVKNWRAAVTREEFHSLLDRLSTMFPEKASLFQDLVPCSHVGHILLTRTGPACPEITPFHFYGDYIVSGRLKNMLAGVPGIDFFPALLKKVVPLNWSLGERLPEETAHDEPEAFLLNGAHSPETARRMGHFHELILPDGNWYDIRSVPTGSQYIRVSFRGDLPHAGDMNLRKGRVKLAFEPSSHKPWVRLKSGSPELFGCYVLAREDVVEVIRESARWTLGIQEVENL
ncbi:MAG: hypothetical protein AKCLJLPJ_02569 [Fimbriimonadales bacterium]|nr:hypothetical protein [Fimbriimonadales bacterium]